MPSSIRVAIMQRTVLKSASPKMRILVATYGLDAIGGTEVYTFALLEELVRRGFAPDFFAFRLGYVSDRIKEELSLKQRVARRYDLILANHKPVVEWVRDRGTVLQTCHGYFDTIEAPSPFAAGHVSVSAEVAGHIAGQGVSSTVVHNGVNCERFRPVAPIGTRLRAVLCMCRGTKAKLLIRQACVELGVECIIPTHRIWNMEVLINQVDLVVGVGRTAYDALACGRPVLVFDERPYMSARGDGYFADVWRESLEFNCSGRWRNHEFTVSEMKMELSKYKRADGALAREIALNHFNIRRAVDDYLDVATNTMPTTRGLSKATFGMDDRRRLLRLFFAERYPTADRRLRRLRTRLRGVGWESES